MSERSELYVRLSRYATCEILSWPRWKRDSIVMYRESKTEPLSVRALRLQLPEQRDHVGEA
jgi:hypothetical protein